MTKPWHLKQPGLLAQAKEDLAAYPKLRLFIEGDRVMVRGTYPVLDDDRQTVLEEYEVEIVFPEDYPDRAAILKEVGGRIATGADYHMGDDRVACVVVEEEWLLRPDHASLRGFLAGPVREYFLWQSLVAAGKPAPWPARPHGLEGVFEAYGEWCGTTDRAAIRCYLEYLIRKKIKGHLPCPCGSGQRLRNCHQGHVLKLRSQIPRKVAAFALQRIKSQQGRI
jgi:SEC-C motif